MEDLRDIYDPPKTRELLFKNVAEAFQKRFPMENDQVRIELDQVGYDPDKMHMDRRQLKKALLEDGRAAVPLRGRIRLLDKKMGHVLDEQNVILANIPYMTDRGTFIYGGNEYITSNQTRLRPGIYTREKDNGEMEAHINTKSGTGPQMRLFMEPETGIYRLNIGQSDMKLYPILKAMGVTDPEIQRYWGKQILETNQKAFDKKTLPKFYNHLLGRRAKPEANEDEMKVGIIEGMKRAELDPEVTQRTLGRAYKNLTTDAIMNSSLKLLKIRLGEAEEDDRDSLSNRTFHGVEDLMAERVAKDAGQLGNKLLYRTTYDRSLKYMKPGYFTPQVHGMIVGNSLTSPASMINAMDIYDQNVKITSLGEGGIGSVDAIPQASRNVHPSQFGAVDPIRSSESINIGIDLRFARGAKKKGNSIYFPLRNVKTGKIEYVDPVKASQSVVAFPKAPRLMPPVKEMGEAMAL